MATPAQKTCFIAMPISTPEHLVKDYGGDPDHFRHVLDCLFMPAVEAAGLKPISPISKGSEVIHAELVLHLQTADLVLMDMSALNANAFFEWGIRTSLNLPVCVVRDELTAKIPFDAAPINSETYNWRLDSWITKLEIPKLSAHLKEALERSNGANALWKHFGFQRTAVLAEPPRNDAEKLDLVLNHLTGLSQRLSDIESKDRIPGIATRQKPIDFDYQGWPDAAHMTDDEQRRWVNRVGDVLGEMYSGVSRIKFDRGKMILVFDRGTTKVEANAAMAQLRHSFPLNADLGFTRED